MFQETQSVALYQSSGVGWGGRWEGCSKWRGYMYTHGWFMLRFDRKQQNSVKQLSFKEKPFFLKSKRKKLLKRLGNEWKKEKKFFIYWFIFCGLPMCSHHILCISVFASRGTVIIELLLSLLLNYHLPEGKNREWLGHQFIPNV